MARSGGITFQLHLGWFPVQAGEGEHLVHHLKYQHILPEGKAFGDAGFGQAIVADLFDVHEIGFKSKIYANYIHQEFL